MDQEQATVFTNERIVSESAAESLVGKNFFNYSITEVLGRGAMGVVFKARHLLLDRDVAIKVLHSHLCCDEQAIKRFQQEAQSASKLHHRGIVTVHDFGVMPDGRPYLCMDFVQGISLAEVIAKERLTAERALSVCSKICDALNEAHSKGIVHRDIKPSNVMVINAGTAEEDIRVVDFGIAKVVDEAKFHELTQTGETLGSPPYMSPEQCQSRTLDARSDIYSLGCVLYEMLTGVSPFKADSIYEMVHRHFNSMPDPVAKLRADLRGKVELDALVLKAIAKDPARRFQTAAEFQQAIRSITASASGNLASKIKASFSVIKSRYATKKTAIIAAIVVSSAIPCALTFHLMQPTDTAHHNDASMVAIADADDLQKFSSLKREAEELLSDNHSAAAQAKFAAALEFGKQLGEENRAYQECMAGMAKSCAKQGKSKQAQELQSRLAVLKQFESDAGQILSNSSEIARLTTERMRWPNDPGIRDKLLRALTAQGSLYWGQRDLENTRNCAISIVEMAKSAGTKYDTNRLDGLALLLLVSADEYKLPQAKATLDELLHLSKKLRDDPVAQAKLYNSLGRYYFRTATYLPDSTPKEKRFENCGRALDYSSRAQQMWLKLYGDASPWLADELMQKGMILRALEKYAESEEQLELATAMGARIRGTSDPRVGRALYNLGFARLAWAEQKSTDAAIKSRLLASAVQVLEQSGKIFAKSPTENGEMILSVLAARGKVYELLNQPAEAERCYEKAFTEGRRIDRDSDTAKYAYGGLMRLYRTQNRQHDIDTLMKSVQHL